MAEIYLTQEGLKKLTEELYHLKTVERRRLAKAIGDARAFGDLKENAEYDSAKNAQALCEKRIHELEEKLSQVRILDNEDIPKDIVLIGAKVLLKDMDNEGEIEYVLVSSEEADYAQGKISVASPVGKGLLQKRVDEVVEISMPAGILRYKILKISR